MSRRYEKERQHMKRRFTNQINPTWNRSLCIVCTLIFIGCAQGNYGHFRLDAGVGQAFRDGTVQSGYQYYYSGRETMPYAIIGVDKVYQVPSKYWVAFDPEPQTLKKMSGNVYGAFTLQVYGAHLVAPDGQPIGVWYSAVENYTLRVDPVNRSVEVLFKNPESVNQMR
jgi:hypothetical protein